MISLRQVKGGVSWSLILEMRWSQQREACSHTGNILEESGPVEGCVRLGKVSLSPRPPPMPSSCLREDVYVRRFKCISTGAGAEMKPEWPWSLGWACPTALLATTLPWGPEADLCTHVRRLSALCSPGGSS